jgi:type I restriction enzyme M protein
MGKLILRRDDMMNFTDKANFIWSVADLLRGDFKQSEYGKVILPFTVLRRFDCVLAPTKDKILEMNKTLTVSNKTPIFKKLTGHDYYNVSQFDFAKLIDDSNAIDTNLRDYINGFSDDVKDILDKFEIFTVIEKLKKANLLYLVVQKFSELDLAADNVDNLEMGYMYEELIRRFSELSNETAGEHFTPREVIELMVDLLFDPDMDEMTKEGKVVTIFDPACGTGGMLSVAQNKMIATNTKTTVIPFGQELNPETYATCKSDMILKGNTNSKIVLGNSFSEDGFVGQTFDYMLSNPPFGVEWKKVEKFIKDEALNQGFSGRFGAGTPRISDGSLLFLQHMISKMTPKDKGGSRLGIVFNGSPLFTGDAGSGESEIRKWIIENDLLEAIVALPDQLFYNTGISTYVWILTNRKADRRKGKIRLVNGVSYFEKMRKSLGNKRNVINEQNRADLVRLYSMFEPHEDYKDFDNADFGYSKITVERPVYDNEGKPELDKKGNKKADSSLRDTEIVPLKEDINEYFKREVFPHVTDAWIDQSKTKIGYEIPFTRHFYKFVPLRVSADIMAEIKELEEKIAKNLLEVLAE